jgi:predicted Zn-dependent protease
MLDPDSSLPGSFAGMRLRYILDTEDWNTDVLSWTVDAGNQQRTRIALEFGTGYAAARAGRTADAAAALQRLTRAREALSAAVTASNSEPDATVAREWARILEGQLAAVTTGLAASTATLQELASAEEKLPIEFGPPAIDKPSYELLGEALLAANRPKEALTAFDKALARTPERTASLVGLAQAAEKLGDASKAAAVRSKLQRIWKQ